MQATITTPVKTPTAVPRLAGAEQVEGVIRRPSFGRAIGAPIKMDPENRRAPDQIHGAPKAERSRRPSLDQALPPPPAAEAPRTPRRRSEQMRLRQRTPTASPIRGEGVVMEPHAPVRAYRTEPRELNMDNPRRSILDVKI
ncbi:hypothetical protein CAEBREN_09854 [Caenorhabditis brenneri]|uniref:Uncharacterized protein n=1 Tax=Caenorhabditis brenneri TaxID=135651 RepID=G0MF82_CAEBE|nr:hypothetical protein CAEBREN_09854 [Caenorhabditis brenneri]